MTKMNCLLTKLKASVNDGSLDVIVTDGYLRMELARNPTGPQVNNGFYLCGYQDNPIEIEVPDAIITKVGATSTLIDDHHALLDASYVSGHHGFDIEEPSDSVHVIIKNPENVYFVHGIINVTGGISELEKMPNIVYLLISTNTDHDSLTFRGSDVDWGVFTKLSWLVDYKTGMLYGDVNEFINLPTTLTNLSIQNHLELRGKIDDFGKFINLTVLNFSNTQTTGTIEGFVAKARAAGKTTNSNGIALGRGPGLATFNGNIINQKDGKDYTVTWTAKTITLTTGSNSTTINA